MSLILKLLAGDVLMANYGRCRNPCRNDLSLKIYRYTSGWVSMRNLNFLYGTVEFRAKFGGGANSGAWPVVWMEDASCQASDPTGTDDDCNGQEIDIAEIVPAHGPTIANAQAKIAEYIAHRQLREQQILQTLETLPRGVTIPEMVPAIYADVDPKLHSIAAWSVEAHLLKLEKEGLAERIGEKGWALVEPTA